MPAITAMMLCQLLLRAAGTVVRRRAGAEPEETVFMAVIGTDGWKNTAVSPASHWAARRAACANTLGIQVSLPAAIVLSAMSALGACGASGVAGGSLLLIPMACSLFGISNDVAMQMVGVGFIIGVVQDSVETALNSAGDVEFAATAEYHQWRKQGKSLPEFLTGKKN